jgi:hypothetical protein
MLDADERVQNLRRAAEERKAAGVTITPEHNWVKKSIADPKSMKKAIAAMCFQCMGGTEDDLPDGGWKDLIRTCTAPTCALFRFRPYK